MQTGYSSGGGGFNNALSGLRSAEMIERGGDPLRITPAGLSALDGRWDPLPTGPDLLEHWYAQVGKAGRLVLEALVDVWPDTLTKEELAERCGYAASGGGFNNALSRLRTLQLIDGHRDLSVDPTLAAAHTPSATLR